MADNKKITELTEDTTVQLADLIPIVVDVATTPAVRKATVQNVITDGLNGLNTRFGLSIILGNKTEVITTGIKLYVEMPFSGTIDKVNLFSNLSGSIVIDLWKDTLANFPPTVADTITASDKPALVSATNSTKTSFTGWTLGFTAGDILVVRVDSCTTCTLVTMAISGVRTY